jgi:hypothetical protein
MKTSKLWYLWILCILMVFNPNTAIAQQPDHAAVSSPAATAAITPFFLYSSTTTTQLPWWQSHTVIDSSGGVHVAFNTVQSIYYAYCANNCGTYSNWTETAISASGTFDSLDYPTLSLDSQGRPRLMWYWGHTSDFVYAECNSACTTPGSWKSVHVPVSYGSMNYAHDDLFFTTDTHGRPRFVASESGGFQYLTCDSNCTSAASWHDYSISVSGYNSIDALKLVFNASDKPRAVGVGSNPEDLVYLECDGDCTQSSGWSAVMLNTVGYYYDDYGYSLRLDAQGHPRVAYYKASGDDSLYYAWSNGNSTSSSGWKASTLNLPPYAYSRSVDLAIDSHGLPRVAYATQDGDLGYAVCKSACETTKPTWQFRTIETHAGLDTAYPIAIATGCFSDGWFVEGWTSLALDLADHTSISYYTRHLQMCQDPQGHISTVPDVWTIRFASLGSEGGPRYYAYLPMITKK